MPNILNSAPKTLTPIPAPSLEIKEKYGLDSLVNIEVAKVVSSGGNAFIWAGIKSGKFPAPDVVLGTRFTRWRVSTLQNWLADPKAWAAANIAQREKAGAV